EVLQLDQPTGPSAGTVCAVKLEHAVSSAVPADCILHCLVLLHGGFCKLLAEHESGLDSLVIRITDQFFDSFFVKGICFHAVLSEPFFQLMDAVWVFESCDCLHRGSERFHGTPVKGDCISYNIHIQGNASVIDFLIEMI